VRRGDAAPWAWALWLLGLAAALGYGAWRAWGEHESARTQLETLEPRYARLVGLADERARLDAALTQAEKALGRHAYPSSRDVSQAGNDAQQRAREIFTKAGLDVISIQLLPAKAADRFDRIPVTLRLEGDLPALQAALAALPTMAPTLFVAGFNVQGAGSPQPERALRVVAQLELFALRART
jgi:general secretion pathway protein M